ncbi:MAG: hypothetical protein IT361_11520 [Gemmatimonadaceae bacterium]|nr:hypothetical protein [Gemmatimonadaceae bacterium]
MRRARKGFAGLPTAALLWAACQLVASACRPDGRVREAGSHGADSSGSDKRLLGDEDVDFVLERLDVGGAVPLGSGEFALLDYRGKQIVVFDTSGAMVRRFGRGGGGPGELLFPQGLVRMLDDRIGVVDGRKLALVVFSYSGVPMGQLPLDTLVDVSPTRLLGLRHVGPGRWLVAERISVGSQTYERLSLREGRRSIGIDSTQAATVKPTVYPCNVIVESGEAPVFWPTLRWDAAPGFHARTTRVEYQVALQGADRHVAGLPIQPREADRVAALRERLGGTVQVGTIGCRLSRESALEQRSMASRIPVVRSLRVSPQHQVWVQRDAPHGTARPIDVFDASGHKIATMADAPMPLFFLTDTTFVSMEIGADSGVALWLHRVPSLLNPPLKR